MKKIALIIGLVGISLGLFFFLQKDLSSQKTMTNVQKDSPRKSPALDLKNTKLSDVVKTAKIQKANIQPKEPATKDLSLKEQCKVDRQRIVELTLDEFKAGVENGEIFFKADCQQFEDKSIEFWSKQFYENCTKEGIEYNPRNCSYFSFWMKAQILFEDLVDFDVGELSDQQLVFGFFSGVDEKKKVKIVEELEKRFPDSPGVAKIGVTVAMNNFLTREEHNEVLRSKIDRAIEMNPDDPNLIAIDMKLAIDEKEPGVLESIRRYNKENPDSGEGYYALAYQASFSKNTHQLISYLQKAIEIEPRNTKYRGTLVKIKDGREANESFIIRVSYSPDDF